ncbi:primosomal protein N' [Streptomyces bohaiensis]|uniref:primosomal protein N' n=1 Tax=Streptomyces bohaiensis TaxID=1431344 RepID=UPI003B775E67
MSTEHDQQEGPEQLALLSGVRGAGAGKQPRARPRTWRDAPRASALPVARVLVDKGQLHLDRLFDYAVPEALDADARPGVRVRVRFGAGERGGRREGGGLINGFVVERVARSDFPGTLAPLAQVLSPEPVLTPELLTLCRSVADRYAGSLADVVQLAVPPRMARAERAAVPEPPPRPAPPEPGGWQDYRAGAAYLDALTGGRAPRAVWNALPGPGWPDELARAIAATLAGGRGALAVLPDGRAAARVDAALNALLGPGHHVLLTADAGAESRYRRWLAVHRGAVRAVVGTRAAAFAPVRDLGLLALWDDGDPNHREERAPQPHAREVLLLRAVAADAGLLLGGHSRTAEAAQLVAGGWAGELTAPRATVRERAPAVRTLEERDDARDPAARSARLPSHAWETVRGALADGPVLVQVPRRGYVPRLACDRCRHPATCAHCPGPLQSPGGDRTPRCGWCGRETEVWHCPECGGGRLRASVVGARRTAEELGRAFPAVPVRTSGRDHVLDTVPDRPALVVATPGAEPRVEDGPGYAAALLLDGWALLGRPDLRAGEEALRRWLNAASLVRPAPAGGSVVVVLAEPTARPVQALVRWDPAGHAERELGERAQLGLPPVTRLAAVTGPPEAVTRLLRASELPDSAQVLGTTDVEPPAPGGRPPRRGTRPPQGETWQRALVRSPPADGAALATALRTARAARLAHGDPAVARVRVDPVDIG